MHMSLPLVHITRLASAAILEVSGGSRYVPKGVSTIRLLIPIRVEHWTSLKQLSQEQGRKTKITLSSLSVWLIERWMDRV